jgi:ketosteroid isomerase-like protein
MRPRELAHAWFEMCRTGDEQRLNELATEDYVAHGPGGSGDRETFVDWLRWYARSFADQRPVLADVIAGDDRIVVRYAVRSTYRGGYLDLPASGQPVEETGIIIFRLAGGKVAETWFEGNDLEVAQQLGGEIAPMRGGAAAPAT